MTATEYRRRDWVSMTATEYRRRDWVSIKEPRLFNLTDESTPKVEIHTKDKHVRVFDIHSTPWQNVTGPITDNSKARIYAGHAMVCHNREVRCVFTNAKNSLGIMEFCHILDRANYDKLEEMRTLEYHIGVPCGEWNIDTSENILLMMPTYHTSWDRGLLAMYPCTEVLQNVSKMLQYNFRSDFTGTKLKDYRAEFPKELREYSILALGFDHPITVHTPAQEGEISAEKVANHYPPFSDLRPRSIANPVLITLNLFFKLRRFETSLVYDIFPLEIADIVSGLMRTIGKIVDRRPPESFFAKDSGGVKIKLTPFQTRSLCQDPPQSSLESGTTLVDVASITTRSMSRKSKGQQVVESKFPSTTHSPTRIEPDETSSEYGNVDGVIRRTHAVPLFTRTYTPKVRPSRIPVPKQVLPKIAALLPVPDSKAYQSSLSRPHVPMSGNRVSAARTPETFTYRHQRLISHSREREQRSKVDKAEETKRRRVSNESAGSPSSGPGPGKKHKWRI